MFVFFFRFSATNINKKKDNLFITFCFKILYNFCQNPDFIKEIDCPRNPVLWLRHRICSMLLILLLVKKRHTVVTDQFRSFNHVKMWELYIKQLTHTVFYYSPTVETQPEINLLPFQFKVKSTLSSPLILASQCKVLHKPS